MSPTILKITRRNGVAGQISYSAVVDYDGEISAIAFIGSTHGGPVVMVAESGAQTFVREPERFGTFGPEWVRRFFA